MIVHKGTRPLITQRLRLRRFTADDAAAMFENWAGDERVARYLTWDAHKSPKDTERLLRLWCAAYADETTYNWLMEYRGTPIGNISVVRMEEESGCADLGYCMGCAYWNKGLMTEAVRAAVGYLFGEVGADRLRIVHAVQNPASGRVAQKSGFPWEETRRAAVRTAAGEVHDTEVYGMTRSEWETLQ